MTAPAGFAGQSGCKSESTVGTAVTVDTFLPILSEGLKQEIDRIRSKSIRSGRRVQHTWRPGKKKIGGPLKYELPNLGMATELRDMFGSVSTSGGGPYTHTATPGDLTGKAKTRQIGRPQQDGTVVPFTYAGCKNRSWDLGFKTGEIATLDLDITAMTETVGRIVQDGVTATNTTLTSATALFAADDVGLPVSGTGIPAATTISSVTNATTVVLSQATTASNTGVTVQIGRALASASYPSGWSPFSFIEGTITVAGTAIVIQEGNLKCDLGLADDRWRMGSATVKEQLEKSVRSFAGKLVADWTSLVAYRRFVNGTEAAMVLTFSNGTESLTITMNVVFDGETPVIEGEDAILMQSLPYTLTSGTSDAAAITAVLINSESSAA